MQNNGQSCLEKRGIDERQREIVRSDYNKEDSYSAEHKDAISDGDVQGKGTNHGGHSHWLPNCDLGTTMIDYSNFDTTNGGGLYDIKGRNGIGGREYNNNISMYSKERPYGSELINTAESVAQGQYVMQLP